MKGVDGRCDEKQQKWDGWTERDSELCSQRNVGRQREVGLIGAEDGELFVRPAVDRQLLGCFGACACCGPPTLMGTSAGDKVWSGAG